MPRVGAPLGPAGTYSPSRPRRRLPISSGVRRSAGTSRPAMACMTRRTGSTISGEAKNVSARIPSMLSGAKRAALVQLKQVAPDLIQDFQGVGMADDGPVGQLQEQLGGGHQTGTLVGQNRLQVEPERRGKGLTQAGNFQVGNPREGLQQAGELVALGRLSEDVQAVADLGARQLAQVAVKLLNQVRHFLTAHLREGDRGPVGGQGVFPLMDVVAVVLRHQQLEVGVQVGFLDQVPNLLLHQRHLGRIEHLNLVVFIDKLHELSKGPVGVGTGHGGRQVIDDDGMGAPFGLRRLHQDH